MHIKIKFILIFLTLAIVPFLVMMGLSYNSGKEDLKKGLGEFLQRVSHETMEGLDRSLHTLYHNVQGWSNLNIMQDILTGDLDGKITSHLIDVKQQTGSFLSIDALNMSGTVVASSKPRWIGQSFAGEAFLAVAGSGRPHIEDFHRDASTDTWVVRFSFPIRAAFKEDQIIGVLSARWRAVDLNRITQIPTSGDHVSNPQKLIVLRSDGLVISAPEEDQEALFTRNLMEEGLMAARLASHKTEGNRIETIRGERPSLIGFHPSTGYEDFKGLGWSVLIIQDLDQALAPIERLKMITFGTGALVMLIVAVLIVYSTLFMSHQLVYTDSVTHLPGDYILRDRIAQSLSRVPWMGRKMAVFTINIDEFDRINDTIGHKAGNQLLQQVAGRLTGCFRHGDTVSREGASQFRIAIEIANLSEEAGLAQKVIDALSSPFKITGQDLFVTCSIGIAVYPDDGKDAEALLQHSDIAMQRAKEEGNNSIRYYSPEMSARASKRLSLQNQLRYAMERGEFFLNYQPIVDLRTGQVDSVETLLRWKHPDGGMVSPVEFIPLAEESGLILPIGEWVLRTACRQAKAWQAAGNANIRVAVNLSGRQIQRQNVTKMVEDTLRETGLAPRQLELELTESILMKEPEKAAVFLAELKRLGVRIALDDFGTGYSSLSYLRRFPINTLKIDGSFIRDLTTHKDDAAIVETIIFMGHALRLSLVAEGVETQQQLDFLRSAGCDRIQGFFFSRPLSAEKATDLLSQGRVLAI